MGEDAAEAPHDLGPTHDGGEAGVHARHRGRERPDPLHRIRITRQEGVVIGLVHVEDGSLDRVHHRAFYQTGGRLGRCDARAICHDARVRGMVRVKRILGRLRGYFPLTLRGVLVAGVAGVALSEVAYRSLDFVVLTLAYAALGLVGLGLAVVLLAALVLRGRRAAAHLGESRLLTDRFMPTDFGLRRPRFVPLLEMDVALRSPRFERREEDGRELVRASHRGEFLEVERSLVLRDAFGLAEIELPFRGGALYALPHLGKLEATVAQLSMATGTDLAHPHGAPEGDRVELRRYVVGDPARYIHWKIYARSGELVVRMPEHAIERADRVAVYFVAGERDEASAALTLAIARSSDLADRVILGCDGAEARRLRSIEEVERAVARSHGHRGGTEVVHFVREVDRSGPAALVLIVPPVGGPWLSSALEVVRGRPGGARILVGIDGMDVEKPSLIERVVFRSDDERPGAASPSEVRTVVSAFQAAGADVVVIDRTTGRALTEVPTRRKAA